jgi:predicted DCC family thiol-disulfide oxidoreductase YuxK
LSSPPPVLLYDGYCALCNGWVSFLLRFNRGGSLRFAALSGDTGTRLRAQHPELAGVDSLVLVSGERVAVRSTAVFQILSYLGWPWKAALVFRLIPREIRDSLYDIVAYWRYRVFGRYDACPIPPADQRHRFLP